MDQEEYRRQHRELTRQRQDTLPGSAEEDAVRQQLEQLESLEAELEPEDQASASVPEPPLTPQVLFLLSVGSCLFIGSIIVGVRKGQAAAAGVGAAAVAGVGVAAVAGVEDGVGAGVEDGTKAGTGGELNDENTHTIWIAVLHTPPQA